MVNDSAYIAIIFLVDSTISTMSIMLSLNRTVQSLIIFAVT